VNHVTTSHPRTWAWQKRFIASSSHPIRPTLRPVDQPYTIGSRGATDRADHLAIGLQWRTAITSVRPNVDRTKPLSLVNWTSYIPQDPDAVCPRKVYSHQLAELPYIPTDAAGRSQQSRLDLFIEMITETGRPARLRETKFSRWLADVGHRTLKRTTTGTDTEPDTIQG
jgi:hypothetical protein